MLNYIIRRTIIGVITVFFIITIVFFLLRLIPGDPADIWLGEYTTPELVKLTREKWGLNEPILNQYVIYIKNTFHGDLGNSLRLRAPVSELIVRHYPFTVRLVLFGVTLSLIIALPAGIIAASRQNSIKDVFVMIFSFLFISTPSFWMGLMALFIFSFYLKWFPAIGGEDPGNYFTYFPYLILPAMCISRALGCFLEWYAQRWLIPWARTLLLCYGAKG